MPAPCLVLNLQSSFLCFSLLLLSFSNFLSCGQLRASISWLAFCWSSLGRRGSSFLAWSSTGTQSSTASTIHFR